MSTYLRPDSLTAALDALGRQRYGIVAGGTDLYPAHVGRPITGDLLDITAIPELRGVDDLGDHWRVGAAATWSEVCRAPLPASLEALRQAGREIGGAQIQNAGTVCGNLCNASPAADGVPALLALGARVELRTADATTVLPLEAFILGPRRIQRSPDQLVTAVLIPSPPADALSGFRKLGSRRYLVISIVMAAAAVTFDADDRIAAARVAVGACSPVARRLPALEAALAGATPTQDWSARVSPSQFESLAPIDDVRASREYRLEAALTVVTRLLRELQASR
ncbi:MAG: FAD binding domain-containing protein [Burkholderiales bacterium]